MRTFKARRSWRAFILRRQTTFGASPHGRQDLAARPEVHRGRFSTVLLDLELDLLTFVERAQSGALDGGDVHEDIPASTCGLDETIALLRVEPLHRAARHCRILQVSDRGLITPRRRQAKPACGLGGSAVNARSRDLLITRGMGCREWRLVGGEGIDLRQSVPKICGVRQGAAQHNGAGAEEEPSGPLLAPTKGQRPEPAGIARQGSEEIICYYQRPFVRLYSILCLFQCNLPLLSGVALLVANRRPIHPQRFRMMD